MVQTIGLTPGDRVLDLCCGTGNSTFVMADALGNLTNLIGADLSLGQTRIARKRNRFERVSFIVTDASRASFPDAAFDKVIIPHALHEMHRTERLAVLTEAKRILSAGGRLAVLEMDTPPSLALRLLIGLMWFYWLPFNPETPTRRDMLRRGLVNEVTEAGFGNVSKRSLYNGVFQVVQAEK
jgi:demethylmenaquinone methyltransferase/2-methoxy-6-polyprenyl-1,4-benzoquinol methylase